MKDKIDYLAFIQNYPKVWKDYKRFKALLMDYLPQDKMRRNLILICVDENIPDEIIRTNTLSSIDFARLQKKLINASGCGDEIAEEIINAWKEAVALLKIKDLYNEEWHSISLQDLDISPFNKSCLALFDLDEIEAFRNWTYRELMEKYDGTLRESIKIIIDKYNIKLCQDEILEKNITTENILSDSKDCLLSNNIHTIGDLKKLSIPNVIEIAGFSKIIFDDLFLLLNQYGLIFYKYSPKRIRYLDNIFEAQEYLIEEDLDSYIEKMEQAISLGYKEGYYHIADFFMRYANVIDNAREKGTEAYKKYYEAYSNWELKYYDKEKMIEVCFFLACNCLRDEAINDCDKEEYTKIIYNTVGYWNDAIYYAFSFDNPRDPELIASYFYTIGDVSYSGNYNGVELNDICDKERAYYAFSMYEKYGGEKVSIISDLEKSDDKLEKACVNEWEYEVLDDDTIRITRYIGNKYTIVVPKTIDQHIVSSIGSHIFYYNSNNVLFCKIILPDTIKSIEARAFEPNGNHEIYRFDMKSIKLPLGIEHIGWGAFIKSSIRKIYIGKKANTIEEGAFAGCWDLNVEVDKDNKSYSSNQGALFDKTKQTLLYYSFNKKPIDIPKTVKRIGDSVFASYWLREEKRTERPISIPNHIKEIGDYCFDGHIGNIKLSSNLSLIGRYAFNELSKIDRLVIPGSIKEIIDLNSLFGGDHPYNEDGLSLVIKEGVKRIVLGDKELAAQMPDKTISITRRQFRRIAIPDSVESIEGGEYTFIISDVLCNEGSYAYSYFGRKEVWTPRVYTGKSDWIEPEAYCPDEFIDLKFQIPENWKKEIDNDEVVSYYPFEYSGWIMMTYYNTKIEDPKIIEDSYYSVLDNNEEYGLVESEEVTISNLHGKKYSFWKYMNKDGSEKDFQHVDVHAYLFVVNKKACIISFLEEERIDYRFEVYEKSIIESIKLDVEI